MALFEEAIWCDGCGVEITWGPVVRGKRRYCCRDCSRGLKCECGVRMELEDDYRGGRLSGEVPGGEVG